MTGKPNDKQPTNAASATKRRDGMGRETREDMESWLSSQGLRLDDANGVEVELPRPQVDPAPPSVDAAGTIDIEATAQLDQATIQALRTAAAGSRKPKPTDT